MISFAEEFDVAKSPAEAFAFFDDLGRTPEWNARCVEVKQVSAGARAVGATLLYKYRDPGRVGEMHGVVTDYDPGRELGMRYEDKMLDVSVKFSIAAGAGKGARIRHRIEIQPKSFFAKLMSPIIRGATRRQTADSVARIKKILGG